jgi:hypothetical protein
LANHLIFIDIGSVVLHDAEKMAAAKYGTEEWLKRR